VNGQRHLACGRAGLRWGESGLSGSNACCGRTGTAGPGKARVTIGGPSDRLPPHGSFAIRGSEHPAGPGLDSPFSISGG
jgi:hypothetical protein